MKIRLEESEPKELETWSLETSFCSITIQIPQESTLRWDLHAVHLLRSSQNQYLAREWQKQAWTGRIVELQTKPSLNPVGNTSWDGPSVVLNWGEGFRSFDCESNRLSDVGCSQKMLPLEASFLSQGQVPERR